MKIKFISVIGLLLLFAFVNVIAWKGASLLDDKSKAGLENSVDITSQLGTVNLSGMAGDIESGMLTGLSAPSLEMRENVDFLLSPAILVQECITDDVIVVYPDE
jgi:hypothetical protein